MMDKKCCPMLSQTITLWYCQYLEMSKRQNVNSTFVPISYCVIDVYKIMSAALGLQKQLSELVRYST